MKFELSFRNNVGTDQQLLDDMRLVANKIATTNLTMRDYDDFGIYSSTTVKKRFDSWNKALELAGLTVSYSGEIEELALFKNLKNVWLNLGRQPKRREMKQPLSKYSESGYVRKFGSWRKSLESFVEFIDKPDSEDLPSNEDNDVSSLQHEEIIYKHKTKRIPSERLKVQVLMRDGNTCRLCGIIVTGENIHFDHIKPWSKGGETTLENLQVLCAIHNQAKSDLEYETVRKDSLTT